MGPSKSQNANFVEVLVLQARDGDAKAFDQIVDLYSERLYSHIARLVHDPIEAEDIAQEAFIRAFKNLPGFRGASTFQTWLYRIAGNVAIDSARRRKRRGSISSLDTPLDTEGGSVAREPEDRDEPGPECSLEVDELRRQVQQAIGKLSPKLRRVIVLYELQGLSYEEITVLDGCPLGTVKSRLFNARNSLKVIIQETQRRREEHDMALRPTGRRKKGAGPTKTAQNPAATIQGLRRQVRGWLENATWNQGFKGMDVDVLVTEVYRRADAWVGVFDGHGRVRFLEGWMKRLAELVAQMATENVKRQPCLDEIALAGGLEEDGQNEPSGEVSRSLDELLASQPDVAGLLELLPDGLRQAYGLKVVCNSSNGQIATAIGVEPSKVRGILNQSRELLIGILGSKEECRQASRNQHTGQEGGQTLGKRSAGPAIIASRPASEVEKIPYADSRGNCLPKPG
jgi:RNA polymerase sigma-70 factor (ECF subfamily)